MRSYFLTTALIFSASPAFGTNEPFGADTAPIVLPNRQAAPASNEIQQDGKAASVENSVVKVFCIKRYPDLYKPWTKQAPSDVTGSGVIIEGKRILTNAHVVSYSSQIQIQANQAGDKVSAKVELIAPEMDLAVLKLDDESFFDAHPALQRASALPDEKDSVLVYGYPAGGTSLSITKGIVSRIEFTNYNYPVSGLRIQIDAAINPGNSGGPAVVGNTMVGLAFSFLGGTQNIGYIIPSEEIDLFLRSRSTGRYDGKPGFYDELQTLENPALRRFLHLAATDEGIVVHKVDSGDPKYPLKKWDVITKIGDVDVDDQGMIHQGKNLRLKFQYLIQKIANNGTVPITVIRQSKRVQLNVPVLPSRPLLLPNLAGDYPPYFVVGPLVFSKATGDFVNGYSGNAGYFQGLVVMGSELISRRVDKPSFPDEELVVVSSPFFPHDLSKGYSNVNPRVVVSINGIAIRNLRHLVEVIRDAQSDFITFEFDSSGGETLVFPRKELLASTDDILMDNGVRAQGAPNLLGVWQAKPAP
jgi:S1-C subfamily serine protease